jgi:hypothetical protein
VLSIANDQQGEASAFTAVLAQISTEHVLPYYRVSSQA